MTTEKREEVRPEWKGWALWLTVAGTVYLLATGLLILLAPFGLGAQVSVLAHTILGIAWLAPFLYYLGVHFARRFRDKFSHLLLLGYMAGILFLVIVQIFQLHRRTEDDGITIHFAGIHDRIFM